MTTFDELVNVLDRKSGLRIGTTTVLVRILYTITTVGIIFLTTFGITLVSD
jgi:hypothetical protein